MGSVVFMAGLASPTPEQCAAPATASGGLGVALGESTELHT